MSSQSSTLSISTWLSIPYVHFVVILTTNMENNTNTSAREFDQGIAIARAIGLLMLVVLHSAAVNFDHFSDKWWATNVYDSLARSCVPIFLMISGALFLRKEERLAVFVRKRILRIIPALVFWSLVYLIWQKSEGTGIAYNKWITSMLYGPVAVHLWYLYAIIGLYAFVPLLKKIYSGTNEIEKTFYLVMWFVVASIIPTIKGYFQLYWDVVNIFNLGTFGGLIGYLFLGAYAIDRSKLSNSGWKKWLAVFVASSIATILLTYMYSSASGSPNGFFYNNLSPFVVIAAIATFRLCMHRQIILSAKQQKVLMLITEYSLGIYCVHYLILGILKKLGLSGEVGSAWWSIPVTAIVALAISFGAIGLLRRLPLMRYVT